MGVKEIKNDFSCKQKDVKDSRLKAFKTLKMLLEENKIADVDFDDGETIITYLGNINSFGVSYSLQKTDDDYFKFSGVRSMLIYTNFVIAKQPKSFRNIESGIITMAMELAPTKTVKTEIIEKYAMPYNEKIKQQNMQ